MLYRDCMGPVDTCSKKGRRESKKTGVRWSSFGPGEV